MFLNNLLDQTFWNIPWELLKKIMNIFKCSIGTFKIVCEHTESSRISVGTFWNVLEHWKSSRTCSRTSLRTIEIIHDQLSRNVLECSCGTLKNVPEHSKRFRNELAKHFKLLSEICLRCNLNVLHKKYMNIFKCSIENLNFLKLFMTRFVGQLFQSFK